MRYPETYLPQVSPFGECSTESKRLHTSSSHLREGPSCQTIALDGRTCQSSQGDSLTKPTPARGSLSGVTAALKLAIEVVPIR